MNAIYIIHGKTKAGFLFLLLFFCSRAWAQDSIIVNGILQHNSKYAVAVLEQFGVGSYPILKAEINKETGKFRMALPGNAERGIYRLRYSMANPTEYTDIVLNGEQEVSFTLNLFDSSRLPVFTCSAENAAWYAYRQQLGLHTGRISALTALIQGYPGNKDADILQAARRECKLEFTAARMLYSSYLAKQAGSITARVLQRQPPVFDNPDAAYKLQVYNRWTNYWNDIDMSDTALLNTPLYTELIIGYMMYWIDPVMGFSEKEKTEGFIKSVDTVLNHFSRSPVMKRFALDYLTLGFKEIGQEEVLQYIDEKYNSDSRCNDGLNPELAKRLAAYKELAPGRPAPRIYHVNASGVEQEFLKNVTEDTIIIAFWATWCPHCKEALPILDSAVAGRKNIKVLAISLDTDAGLYAEEIKSFTHMQHYCDYQKWDSRPAKDYHITATPTFFMIDKDRFIIGKYSSINGLIEKFK